MGKKSRKPFIDKKTAEKFTLVSKPYEDPDSLNPRTDHAFLPHEHENHLFPASFYSDNEYSDDYDYMQHLRERGGRLTMEVIDNHSNPRSVPPVFAVDICSDDIEGLANQLDPDIVAALDSDDCTIQNGSDAELDDDFVVMANKASDAVYDEYLNRRSCSTDDENEIEEIFDDVDDLKKFESKSRFTEYSLSSSAVSRSSEMQSLDKQFEQLFCSQYDDTNIGDLGYEDLEGPLNEDNDLFKQIINENSCEVLLHGEEDDDMVIHTGIGSGHVIRPIDFEESSSSSSDEYEFEYAEKPTENCESYLSTYSNVSNHPSIIKLSRRTDMPRGVLEKFPVNTKAEERAEYKLQKLSLVPPNVKRKEESKEETKQRLRLVKEEKRIRRMEKKQNKFTYRSENIKQQKCFAHSQPSGKTIL